MAAGSEKVDAKTNRGSKEKPMCGIVRPISAFGDYTVEHWVEVHSIISECCDEIGFTANMVSTGDEVGLIHERIVNNLYNNEVVVVDVSGKNPNVMFELGLRLAFDKPTVIIKDSITKYDFDTGVIDHLEYPKDLRYSTVSKFKTELINRIKATHDKYINDKSYSPFLKRFLSSTDVRKPAEINGFDNNVYNILNKANDKAIDVKNYSMEDGATVHLWKPHRYNNQKWKIQQRKLNLFSITSVHSDKCLEVKNGSHSNSAPIEQNDYTGAPNQLWEIVSNGDGSFLIIANSSRKLLEQDAKTLSQDGGVLIQHEANGGEHQKWIFKESKKDAR